MARTRLSAANIDEGLARLDGWKAEGESAISKEFAFESHVAALGFVVKVAATAETLDHHPAINWVYNRVAISLSTHDAGGVTQKDFELAARIDAVR